jgi:FKBP-type peptidyl-prolyl cis-trans isomerase
VKKLLQLSQNFHHLIYIVSMTMTTLLFTKIIKATTTTTATQRQSHAAIAIAIAIASRRYHFSSSSNNKMGLTKEVLKEGNGQKPTAGQEVSVHCTGYGKNRDLTKVFWCK